jgi:hypothetical protein
MKRMSKRLTWAQRIEAARARGWFTEGDKNRASEWTTCAVGEALPAEVDRWLSTLSVRADSLARPGLAFAMAVGENDFAAASRLLAEIKHLAKSFKAVRP